LQLERGRKERRAEKSGYQKIQIDDKWYDIRMKMEKDF